MEVSIVKIGNSRGIRIPKMILNRLNITDKLEMKISGKNILLSPVEKPRENWADAFAKMHSLGEDSLEKIPDSDSFEWEW